MAGVDWKTADSMATRFASPVPTGMWHRAMAAIDGSWPRERPAGQGVELCDEQGLAGVLWLEPDAFNSECFSIQTSRLHHRITRPIEGLAAQVEAIDQSELIYARVVGHDVSALTWLEREGWHLIATNLCFYRPPEVPPPSDELRVPNDLSWHLRDLSVEPFGTEELERWMKLGEESFFPDRFALDPRIANGAARVRFCRVMRNALSGELVDRVITAVDATGEPAGMVFFGVDLERRLAGRWLTACVGRHHWHKRLGRSLVAEAIRSLPETPIAWTWTAFVGNLASVEAYHELGFRLACVTYDLHRWRNA